MSGQDDMVTEIISSGFDSRTSTNINLNTIEHMSKKFNGFENYLITEALKLFAEKAKQEAISAEKEGVNLIFSPDYFPMVCNELTEKVNGMTLKEALISKSDRNEPAV